MSFAFFIAVKFQNTPLAFLSPYFDQIIAILIMLFMIPETVRMLTKTFRELFLFSPDQETVNMIKKISGEILDDFSFVPVNMIKKSCGFLSISVLQLIPYL